MFPHPSGERAHFSTATRDTTRCWKITDRYNRFPEYKSNCKTTATSFVQERLHPRTATEVMQPGKNNLRREFFAAPP
jgi:hypothetical protein